MTPRKPPARETASEARWEIPEKLGDAAKRSLATAKAGAVAVDLLTIETFDLLTVSEAIQLLAVQRNQNYMRLLNLGLPHGTAQDRANQAWREALPELTGKHNVLIYLAAVAWGMRTGIVRSDEAKLMIFLAQTQLTVLKMEMPGPCQDSSLRGTEVDSRQMSLLPDRSIENA